MMDVYVIFTSMVIAILLSILLILTIIARITNKSLKHLINEIKFEIKYGIIGILALLDDWVLREKDITGDLPMGSGRIALITGGTRGIGAEVVKKLLEHDLHVIIGCRNVEVGKKLYEKFHAEGSVDIYELDLTSLTSVRSFAKIVKSKYSRINVLINNAGIMFGPYKETEDGYESQFASNYLGHFLLTHLLLPELIVAGESRRYSRIVNVSSCAHTVGEINFKDINLKQQYISSKAYAQSKLAQILFSNYLNTILKDGNKLVGVYSVHPGIVNTDLFKDWVFNGIFNRRIRRFFFKSAKLGSVSVVYACLARKLEIATGTYISNSQITPMAFSAYSTDLQKELFEFTMNILNIKKFGVE